MGRRGKAERSIAVASEPPDVVTIAIFVDDDKMGEWLLPRLPLPTHETPRDMCKRLQIVNPDVAHIFHSLPLETSTCHWSVKAVDKSSVGVTVPANKVVHPRFAYHEFHVHSLDFESQFLISEPLPEGTKIIDTRLSDADINRSLGRMLAPTEGPCHKCGRAAATRYCGCRRVRYCDHTCQKRGWATHKQECPGKFSIEDEVRLIRDATTNGAASSSSPSRNVATTIFLA